MDKKAWCEQYQRGKETNKLHNNAKLAKEEIEYFRDLITITAQTNNPLNGYFTARIAGAK